MGYLEDLYSLDGKVAVAIGAGGVLAGAMAEALGGAGAKVAVLDLNGEAADQRAESIRNASGSKLSVWQSTLPARRIYARPLARS